MRLLKIKTKLCGHTVYVNPVYVQFVGEKCDKVVWKGECRDISTYVRCGGVDIRVAHQLRDVVVALEEGHNEVYDTQIPTPSQTPVVLDDDIPF